MAVDGLALDPIGRRLYMTAYDITSGVVAVVSLDEPVTSYTEIVTGLDMPRAIALDLQNRCVKL